MREVKSVQVPGQVLSADPVRGEVRFLGSVTGVLDEVGDVVMPGAYAETLRKRSPEFLLGHDPARPIGQIVDVKELLPGDPGLPAGLPHGAGALVATAKFDLSTKDGRDAFAQARFFGPKRTHYSIGYIARKAASRLWRGAVARVIDTLDLFELSQVLHPANRHAVALAIKAGRPEGLEYKDAPVVAGTSVITAAELAEASALLDGDDLVIIDADELKAAVHAFSPDEVGELDGMTGIGFDDFYRQSLADEVEFEIDAHGEPHPLRCATCGAPAGPAARGYRSGDQLLCRRHAPKGWAA
jgi:HK97 family phage prohead protease